MLYPVAQVLVQRRTTLHDIATQAGVSTSTVSAALAGKASERRISAEVVARVQQCAQKLDYAPNRVVQTLQRGRSHILSFFNGFRTRGGNDLYIDRLSNAIERAAGEQGYDILFNCNFDKTPEALYQHLNGGLVDGVIFFAPRVNDPLLPYLRLSRLPCVLVNRDDPEGILPSVRDDLEAGLEQVADALYWQAPRRLILLDNTDPQGRPHLAERRLQGLRKSLARRGYPVPETDPLPYTPGQSDMLLKSLAQEPCTLFCWHDRLAYQVLQDCERLEIPLPEPLSLIGYDGVHWPVTSRHVVTSVSLNLDTMAAAVLKTLLLRCEGQPVETVQRIPVALQAGTTFVL